MKIQETLTQDEKKIIRRITAGEIPLEGETCLICGTDKNVTRHHISYEPIEIAILCEACHQRIHVPDFRKLHPRKIAKSCSGKVILDKFYTPKEAAEKLGLALKELYLLVKKEIVPTWDMPSGPRHKGWHGRTLTAAGHALTAYKKQIKKANKNNIETAK